MNTRFLTRKGRTVRLVEWQCDVPRDFWYLDATTGREFDVRDLPEPYLAEERDPVFAGDRDAHRRAITRAIDAGYQFQ